MHANHPPSATTPPPRSTCRLRPGFAARTASAASWSLWVLFVLASDLCAAPALPRAAVFADRLPGLDGNFAREIATQVSASGYAVEFIGVTTLTNADALSAEQFDLLVLPEARALPAVSAPAVESYLKQGGDLLALGLPAWESALFEVSGQWVSRASFDAAIAGQRAEHLIFNFANADLHQWQRTSDDARITTRHEIVPAGGGKALHVTIEKLTGWDTFLSPPLTNPFPAGHTLTCFRARGTPHTKQLALEWTERDGSRWIATVDLTPDWKNFALPPEAFKGWEPPSTCRDKNNSFRPQNAARFVVGLAHSHTAVEGTQQEYWFADLGTAASPFGNARLPGEFKPPHLESVSPDYQFFAITTPAAVDPTKEAAPLVRARDTGDKRPATPVRVLTNAATQVLQGIHPRPRGVGFNQDRASRWEPLLAAYDISDNDHRGAVAALLVHVKPPFRGGVWAAFTLAEASFYRQPVVQDCLRQTLARMRRGIFLVEGGAEFFTTFPGQNFAVGARVANFSRETATNISVSVMLGDARAKRTRVVAEMRFSLAPGEIRTCESQTILYDPVEAQVRVNLQADGKLIDLLRHEIGVWRPRAKPEFIAARDGGFWLRDKPWKANGVNYMPSSGIGLADWRHFEHWVGRGAYDPEVIERDLRRIQAMNLNAVSVFIYRESLGAQHMLDFLLRCEAHGLKVNLSLRPGTPLDFRWDEMKEIIQTLRLAQNDTVFAYDLAWEPRHEPQALQADYAKLWPAWVEKRYGNREAACKAWDPGDGDFKFEISDLKSVPAPPMKWFTQDGPWRKLVADYRLFLDELLREKYSEARRLVKSIDPNHTVSFRMQHAGDPTFNWDAFLPYDFHGLASAVDIWEPEAYGRIGDWERVKPGRFTADYARLCDAAKPLLWAEMGYSVWDNHTMSPAPDKLEFQARYFRDFYRMMAESGADGIFFWWYPGGYRLNEQSDFGIINPDGTDRPVTKVIRGQGGRLLKSSKPAWKPDHWIPVDRDCDARGLFGIYEAVKADYWHAIETGKTPGLKTRMNTDELGFDLPERR